MSPGRTTALTHALASSRAAAWLLLACVLATLVPAPAVLAQDAGLPPVSTPAAAATPADATAPAAATAAKAPPKLVQIPPVQAPPPLTLVPPVQPAPAQVDAQLRKTLADTRTLANALMDRVSTLKGKNSLSPAEVRAYQAQINSLTTLVSSFEERANLLFQKQAQSAAEDQPAIEREQTALERQADLAKQTIASIGAQLDGISTATGWTLIDKLLTARCSTAICFDNGDAHHWLGIEPLVELPIGIAFSVDQSSLSDYVNNHDIRVDLAAGARVWLFRDVVSLSVYISKPLIDSSIRLTGSNFVYPGASVRRPLPGFALGFLFDSIWLGFDRNELRNGDGNDSSAANPDFAPNSVISSAWTVTLALQPVTAFRAAIGTAVQANKAGSQ